MFTNKTVGGSEWEGGSVAVWGYVLFQRVLREDSTDEKTFKRKSWRGEGLCRELKSISGRGKGKGKVLGVSVHTAFATVRRYRCQGLSWRGTEVLAQRDRVSEKPWGSQQHGPAVSKTDEVGEEVGSGHK